MTGQLCCLERAVIVDRSYMGRLLFDGDDAVDLLNRLSTNDLSEMSEGRAVSTVLTNSKGRVLDLLVVGLSDGELIVMTSQGNQSLVTEWIDQYTFTEDVTVRDVTNQSCQFTITGDGAEGILRATGITPPDAEGKIVTQEINGLKIRCWSLPFGTNNRYEILMSGSQSTAVWEALTGEGATPVPYDVWEFHRIANGFPVYGAEFGVQTNPLESRLQGSISYNKGCYIGQEVIARLTTYKKVQRRLMSARLDGSVQAGARLIFEGTPVGYITSSATSPLGQYTAISMVNSLHAIVGKEMSVADTEIAVELIEPAYALSTEPALVID